MRILIAIIKYTIIAVVVLGIFKVSYNLVTEKKAPTLRNIGGEIKGLISSAEDKIANTNEKHLYKDIGFRIVKKEEGDYKLSIWTEKKYPTCGYKITYTTKETTGKISVKLNEVKKPEGKTSCQKESPASVAVDIKLEEVLSNELTLSRNVFMDRYLVELDRGEIKITPPSGIFSKAL